MDLGRNSPAPHELREVESRPQPRPGGTHGPHVIVDERADAAPSWNSVLFSYLSLDRGSTSTASVSAHYLAVRNQTTGSRPRRTDHRPAPTNVDGVHSVIRQLIADRNSVVVVDPRLRASQGTDPHRNRAGCRLDGSRVIHGPIEEASRAPLLVSARTWLGCVGLSVWRGESCLGARTSRRDCLHLETSRICTRCSPWRGHPLAL